LQLSGTDYALEARAGNLAKNRTEPVRKPGRGESP
jgi:hypothetical protein